MSMTLQSTQRDMTDDLRASKNRFDTRERVSKRRRELAKKGMKSCTVFLPEEAIAFVDGIKEELGYRSREKALAALIAAAEREGLGPKVQGPDADE